MSHNAMRGRLAAALTGAAMVGGCAGLPQHLVVMAHLDIAGKDIRPPEPHYYTLDSCEKDGRNMFEKYGRETFKQAAAKARAPVDAAWHCREWTVTSGKGFELRRATITPLAALKP